jgi:hypothetical protein
MPITALQFSLRLTLSIRATMKKLVLIVLIAITAQSIYSHSYKQIASDSTKTVLGLGTLIIALKYLHKAYKATEVDLLDAVAFTTLSVTGIITLYHGASGLVNRYKEYRNKRLAYS